MFIRTRSQDTFSGVLTFLKSRPGLKEQMRQVWCESEHVIELWTYTHTHTHTTYTHSFNFMYKMNTPLYSMIFQICS
jgi:hypothetical protein